MSQRSTARCFLRRLFPCLRVCLDGAAYSGVIGVLTVVLRPSRLSDESAWPLAVRFFVRSPGHSVERSLP